MATCGCASDLCIWGGDCALLTPTWRGWPLLVAGVAPAYVPMGLSRVAATSGSEEFSSEAYSRGGHNRAVANAIASSGVYIADSTKLRRSVQMHETCISRAFDGLAIRDL